MSVPVSIPGSSTGKKLVRATSSGQFSFPINIPSTWRLMLADGRTFQAIADGLMADWIPTARGHSRWFPATIKAVTISDNAATLT